jgi:hypothetical protein
VVGKLIGCVGRRFVNLVVKEALALEMWGKLTVAFS